MNILFQNVFSYLEITMNILFQNVFSYLEIRADKKIYIYIFTKYNGKT